MMSPSVSLAVIDESSNPEPQAQWGWDESRDDWDDATVDEGAVASVHVHCCSLKETRRRCVHPSGGRVTDEMSCSC